MRDVLQAPRRQQTTLATHCIPRIRKANLSRSNAPSHRMAHRHQPSNPRAARHRRRKRLLSIGRIRNRRALRQRTGCETLQNAAHTPHPLSPPIRPDPDLELSLHAHHFPGRDPSRLSPRAPPHDIPSPGCRDTVHPPPSHLRARYAAPTRQKTRLASLAPRSRDGGLRTTTREARDQEPAGRHGGDDSGRERGVEPKGLERGVVGHARGFL